VSAPAKVWGACWGLTPMYRAPGWSTIGVVDRQTVVVRLELHLTGDSLTGRANDCAGTARGFVGWMGLVAAIDALIRAFMSAPLTDLGAFVGTFRVKDPPAFARTPFVEALRRNRVRVEARAVRANPLNVLPRRFRYPTATRVAVHRSTPYAQVARLVNKVSLNLGANLSPSLFGLDEGKRTIQGACRRAPPPARAALRDPAELGPIPHQRQRHARQPGHPRVLVTLVRRMDRTRVAGVYRASLPILGCDGSLAHTGTTFPACGRVRAKPGTTIVPGADGETIELKAQNMAGYITTRSGSRLACALMVNDVGAREDIESDVADVFKDEAEIADICEGVQ
jgi:hypothetical protein